VKRPSIWPPPTRRAFVAMLLGGAGVAAIGGVRKLGAPEPAEPATLPRWIGHA
jgi:hypothetical protein